MSSTPPPIPSVPPIPAAPAAPVPVPATWWRHGKAAFLTLVLVLAAADFMLLPYFSEGATLPVGFGTAIGTLFFAAALLVLRRDLTRGEQAFFLLLALLSAAAQAVSGSVTAFLLVQFVPFILLYLFSSSTEVDPHQPYISWPSYWVAPARKLRKPVTNREKMGAAGRTVLSLAIGVLAFIIFMAIFAGGNPVVRMVWDKICELTQNILSWVPLSWEMVLHLLLWALGFFLFTLLTMRRRTKKEQTLSAAPTASEVRPPLPHLPLMTLIGVNLAFLITNATDIIYLWRHVVPEGISLTDYLYNGASSVACASLLAALLLLFLFRSKGSARCEKSAGAAGYVLVAQTFLLALSVALRLSYQIDDHGFTPTRLIGYETLLLGLVGLIVLLLYMATNGQLLRHLKLGLGLVTLLFTLFLVVPPDDLSCDLN